LHSGYLSESNHITIELDSNITEEIATEKLNIIFAALGLAAVSSSSRTEDIERIKVMQLFRAFYPKETYLFERDANTLVESVESLKERISKQVVGMKDKFQHYFVDHPEDMYEQEVYPGQTIWAVRGLSDDVRKAGAIGLMMGVTASNFEEAANRTVSLLQAGALSTQDRFQLGIIAKGVSSAADLEEGGGESVFLRMITNSMPKNLNSYLFVGHIQILYDLDLVERVGYAYSNDQYGTKEPFVYKKRSNIVELTNKIEANPIDSMNNEICISHRIAPKFIKGIRVKSSTEKDQLVETLKKEGMVTRNSQNQECFNDIPLDQFIRIGDVKAEYWA